MLGNEGKHTVRHSMFNTYCFSTQHWLHESATLLMYMYSYNSCLLYLQETYFILCLFPSCDPGTKHFWVVNR